MKMSMGEESEEPRTVVVGVKMDNESRELLTWALVKVARASDRVIALHVIPSTSDASDPNQRCSSLLSLVKAFDSVLAVYDGFCNLKQIELKLKLCRGSSTRKVLVKEAMSYDASSLILGIKKNCRGIRSSSTSIAKYCSKKLPKDCSVLAVSNGKIVFEGETTGSSYLSKTHSGKHDCLLAIKSHQLRNIDDSRPSFQCLPSISRARSSSEIDRGDLKDSDINDSRPSFQCLPSISRARSSFEIDRGDLKDSDCSVLPLSFERNNRNCIKSKKGDTLALVPVKKWQPPSVPTREFNGITLGWPLLRKAVLTDKKITAREKSKVSVGQWVIRLPSRYTATPSIDRDENDTRLAGEAQAIVPFGSTNSSRSPLAIDHKETQVLEELRSLQEKYSSVCRVFTYEELKQATSDFSSESLIGRGGSSQVYKGYLSDGTELAVKLLKQSEDALKEFVSEIAIITDLHHENIISLLGFCFENDDLILVYDFLSKGSLEDILHGKKENDISLSWHERYKIATGVAEALDYLHSGGSGQSVIHRDVKSSNILLSEDFIPQLADFGLAMRASSSSAHMTCNDVAGTFGYLAPEYFMYGKVTEKIDIYAFGVVLLELLSGRKPVSTHCPKGEESLVLWAKKILQEGKVKDMVDPSLGDKYDNDQMGRMILASSICIRNSPRARPRMSLVLKLLLGDADALRWARSQVNNASEDFDGLDDESACPNSNIQSHINLAFEDLEDDALSVSSVEHTVNFISANASLEDYLKGRWSRSSSFN